MLKLSIFCSLVIFLSCKKSDTVDSKNNENDVIEVYNFSQLEPFLNKNDNTTYIINFWATWCAPCIKELPYFEELHTNHSNKNIKVLLVSLDFPDKFESQLIPFVKRKNIKTQVVFLDDPNENTWIPKIDESWSGALPATLIYNKEKRSFYQKSFTKESLFKEIEKFTKI